MTRAERLRRTVRWAVWAPIITAEAVWICWLIAGL